MDQFSPKSSSSPHAGGVRSPNGVPTSETGGGLKVTISLKQKTPFYLLKPDPIPMSEITGATNLMSARGLEHSYNKFTTKKMKDSLSSFLSNIPGMMDTPGSEDNSSLRGVIEKPPVCGKELLPLNQLQLAGFRLHPGPLPEQYRSLTQTHSKKRHKHKKHKHKSSFEGGGGGETPSASADDQNNSSEAKEKKREKKHKKHDKDAEERKKKKKDRKKKRKEDKE